MELDERVRLHRDRQVQFRDRGRLRHQQLGVFVGKWCSVVDTKRRLVLVSGSLSHLLVSFL